MNFGDWQSSVAWLAMAVGRLDLASAVARRGRTREGGGSTRRGEGEHGSEEREHEIDRMKRKALSAGFILVSRCWKHRPRGFVGMKLVSSLSY